MVRVEDLTKLALVLTLAVWDGGAVLDTREPARL